MRFSDEMRLLCRPAVAASALAAGLTIMLGATAPVPGLHAQAAFTQAAMGTAIDEQARLHAFVNQQMTLFDSDLVAVDLSEARPGEPAQLSIAIEGKPYTLDLDVHSVRTADYKVFASDGDGNLTPVAPGPVNTYRGELLGLPGSYVTAAIQSDGLYGSAEFPDGSEFWFQPILRVAGEGTEGLHVVYTRADIQESDGVCGVVDLVGAVERDPAEIGPGEIAMMQSGASVCVTELAVDADNRFYIDWGSSVPNTESRVNSVINQMNVQYERDVDITHQINTIIVRTSQVYTTSDAEDLLNQFRSRWLSQHTDILRDLAHLFTGRNLIGGTIGVAWLGQVCASRFNGLGFGIVESDFNGIFSCATDLSAHEIGHNWNSGHCSCSTYTMNPSITCRNRFRSDSINAIVSFRDSISCLICGPPAPPNDNCSQAQLVGTGSFAFDTNNSSTDGPSLPDCCNEGGGLGFVKDIWYEYVPSCTGTATADTCDASFDTRLAIYLDGDCPGEFLACNDDACGAEGTRSEVSFPVTVGQRVLIRVGGRNSVGTGTLVLTCSSGVGGDCPSDVDGSGVVDFGDLLQVLGAWGPCEGGACGGCVEDIDMSGTIDFGDLLSLLADWGPC